MSTASSIALILHAKGEHPFVEHKGEKLPTEISGQPVRYFWKEVLPEGLYEGVKEQDTGLKLSVQPKRIDGLVDTFHAMKKTGFKPFVPTRHKNYDAKDNLGWLVDAKRDRASSGNGDSLYLLHQLIGDDAIKAASRNEASICVKRNYTDDKGQRWDEYVEHCSLCPDSVLTGLKPFEPLDFDPAIAASRDQATPAVVLELAAHAAPDVAHRSDSMKLTPAQITGLQKIDAGKFKDLKPDADAPATLLDDLILVATPKPDVVSLSRADKDKLDKDASDAVALRTEVAALKKGQPATEPEATPNEKMSLSRAWVSDATELVRTGAVDKPTMDKITSHYGFDKKNPTKFALSRASEDSDPEAFRVLDILKGNKPAATPEPGELIALQRQTPGGQPDAKKQYEAGKADAEAYSKSVTGGMAAAK